MRCTNYMKRKRMKANYKKLGDYIKQIKVKNTDGKLSLLLGVNLDKRFIPSVANIIGTDLTKYKVIKKNQFGCKLMSVGRDKKLPISLLKKYDEAIISSAYYVFEIIDKNILLDDYLMMWIQRPETDRYLWFLSGGDIRGSISWDDFCTISLPVPTIEKQHEIVAEYTTVTNRIKLNKTLNSKLEETAQAIYKQWFVDFEFPNEEGKPYKSAGGKMVFNEELEKDVPEGWGCEKLKELTLIKAGGDKPKLVSNVETNVCRIPIYSNSTVNEGLYGYTNKATLLKESITISARGAIIGYTVLRTKPYVPIVRLIVVIPQEVDFLNYIFYCIKDFKYNESGSAQGQLTVPEISLFKVVKPDSRTLKKYQAITSILLNKIEVNKKGNKKFKELQDLLLSKLTSVEN